MPDLSGKRIAILATHGFEQSELEEPKKQLSGWGAEVHVIAPEEGEIKGWDKTDWGRPVKVDRQLSDVSEGDYDVLVLPGGQINPDVLRTKPEAVKLVRAFHDAKKPIGAICHGPWLLAEADVLKGKTVTSWPSIRTDLRNAGAEVVDKEACTDGHLVTSRNPDDVPAFCEAIAEAVAG